MGLFTTTEHHEGGGSTVRDAGTGQSVTYDANGTVLESCRPESTLPLGFGPREMVTYNGDGEIINVQPINDE